MKFSWIYDLEETLQVKTFLKSQGVSRGLLAKVKFQGGKIEVDQNVVNARYLLEKGNAIELTVPDESGHDTTVPVDIPIEIVYEDEHLLIVNKPSGAASTPSKLHPETSMANRVKGYFIKMGYADQVIHIVTRLDRDTTGLMLFAKHGYAHALMDQALRKQQIKKTYAALVTGRLQKKHGHISAPIGRSNDSIITRTVTPEGKPAMTEYWINETFEEATLVDIQLHTGKTHQIRVHFTHIGHPLIGDELYGGTGNQWIRRQALHCVQLAFSHPFTNENMVVYADLPADISEWLLHKKMAIQ